MQISALQPKIDASHLQLESLAGSQALTEDQKIGEASRQFEAVLLRQFLSESQKTVIKSEFTDNSTASGIYQDFITNQLADSLSRGGDDPGLRIDAVHVFRQLGHLPLHDELLLLFQQRQHFAVLLQLLAERFDEIG